MATTINEYLESETLWDKIKTKGGFSFIESNFDELFKMTYGKREVYSEYLDYSVDTFADLVVTNFKEKWDATIAFTYDNIGDGESRTRDVTDNIDNNRDTTQKVSAYNSASLIDDSGTTTNETANNTKQVTEGTSSIENAFNNLSRAEQIQIAKIAMHDVAKLLTVSINYYEV